MCGHLLFQFIKKDGSFFLYCKFLVLCYNLRGYSTWYFEE